jgi:hypothetical protein
VVVVGGLLGASVRCRVGRCKGRRVLRIGRVSIVATVGVVCLQEPTVAYGSLLMPTVAYGSLLMPTVAYGCLTRGLYLVARFDHLRRTSSASTTNSAYFGCCAQHGAAGTLIPASGDSLRVGDEPEKGAVAPYGYEAVKW